MSKKIDYLSIPKDNFSTVINYTGDLKNEFKEKGIGIQISPTQTYWWLGFNMNDSLLGKNKNLRLAVAHAIDIDRMIKVFTNNTALKANSIYPPSVFGYSADQKVGFKYDLELAKSYLNKAGYPDGKNLPEIVFDARSSRTTSRQMAEFVKSELKKIGMNIKIQLNTFPAFLQKARKGELQFWHDGWAMDYPDAENTLQLLYSKNTPPGPKLYLL